MVLKDFQDTANLLLMHKTQSYQLDFTSFLKSVISSSMLIGT